jgi:hypothetical protein
MIFHEMDSEKTDVQFMPPLWLVQYPLYRQQTFLEAGNIHDAWRTYSLHSSAPVTARKLLILIYSEPNGAHVFPYQIIFPQNNSAQNCLTQCSTYGYPAAGMENGDECCV